MSDKGFINLITESKNTAEETQNADKTHEDSVKQENDSIDVHAIEYATEIGKISLNFTESDTDENSTYPKSYTSVTAKERLLLIFAEHFRRQFRALCENRNPLVLAIRNECGVQKFVSTTIRPTVFLYSELIDCWHGPAQFVADFITYEALPNPIQMPNRLISPETLLKVRRGNSFEMATLLCSLLIGNRYGAMVVSGYASREVANNDLKRVDCPEIPVDSDELRSQNPTGEELNQPTTKQAIQENKYKLSDPIDLQSKFLLKVEERKAAKAAAQLQIELQRKLEEQKAFERLDDDPHDGRRVHAWVVILSNVGWAAKKTAEDVAQSTGSSDGETRPFFIEPSTGVHFDANDPNYFGIESVWNESNYFVNCQKPLKNGIAAMQWDFRNTSNWQVLLNDDAVDTFVKRSDTPEQLMAANIINSGKHMDMPNSWVNRLFIENTEFDERYPNGVKIIHYKRTILERYAPYLNKNGVTKRLIFFENLDYTAERMRWEWFQNREDCLEFVERHVEAKQIVENYGKSRKDFLRRYTRCMESMVHPVKSFDYYKNVRLDGLIKLEVTDNYVREYFDQCSKDKFLYYREFTMDSTKNNQLTKVLEKFRRNERLPFNEDVLKRTFDISEKKIFLQFHYGVDEITPIVRVYKCPPKPDYGCEIAFDENENVVDESNRHEKQVSKLKRYLMLLEQLQQQDECIKAFEMRLHEIQATIAAHQERMEHPILTFSIYDPLRNSASRSFKIAKHDQMNKQQELALSSSPDLLAPYLINFTTRMPNAIESVEIYENCLRGIEADHLNQLNELHKEYDELYAEEDSLKAFLNTIYDKLEDFEYEQFLKRGHKLELSKRVVQQRIVDTEKAFQEKYNRMKENMQKDNRLNFLEK